MSYDNLFLWLKGQDVSWVREFRFHPKRRWRFDFALPTKLMAIEIDGGAFTRGRHTRGAGFVKDLEKFNEAGLLGWRVFRFIPDDIASGYLFDTMVKAYELFGGGGQKLELPISRGTTHCQLMQMQDASERES